MYQVSSARPQHSVGLFSLECHNIKRPREHEPVKWGCGRNIIWMENNGGGNVYFLVGVEMETEGRRVMSLRWVFLTVQR